MTLATIVNQLKREGSIEQMRVNRYRILRTRRTEALGLCSDLLSVYTLAQIHSLFAVEVSPGSNNWVFRSGITRPASIPAERRIPVEPPQRRTITRSSYHSAGNGTGRRGLEEALLRIERDADGIRRSYGLEWEIYALNSRQEDKLARLLDTMPAHFTERDGSLSSTGVEIIFLPLGKEKIIEVWTKLQNFCEENAVDMHNTGAHLTYGYSGARVDVDDLQIRLNRIALAVKAASTQRAIKDLFGRDFTGYASLPTSTTTRGHSNAFSASRGNSAYELRLCAWKGNIGKIVEFMEKTEFIFTRTFTAADFVEIFRIMGQNVSGC